MHLSDPARLPRLSRRILTVIGAVGMLAAILVTPAAASPLPPSVPTTASSATNFGPTCWYGACFDYVSGRQDTDASGAAIQMYQADPTVKPGDQQSHSLQELAVQSSDQKSTVEVGWTVDLGLNGDVAPHLFVYHWVDGQESCYNGCGFVQSSSVVQPGMALPSGQDTRFAIENVSGDWWIFYNQEAVGYFPGSLWNGNYTRAQVITAFGEVAHATNSTCEAMGDGAFGSASDSSWISDFQLLDSADPAQLTVSSTSSDLYDSGQETPTSFHLGGPGSGSC